MKDFTQMKMRRIRFSRRVKPGIEVDNYIANGRRTSIRGRLSQFGLSGAACGTLINISDTT